MHAIMMAIIRSERRAPPMARVVMEKEMSKSSFVPSESLARSTQTIGYIVVSINHKEKT